MLSDGLVDQVGRLVAETAGQVLEPRWRRLVAGDVWEKSPGEVVSVADEAGERLIARRLTELLPGTPVVGEEAASVTPGLLGASGQQRAWLVGPLDGTSNFVAGSPECVKGQREVLVGDDGGAGRGRRDGGC